MKILITTDWYRPVINGVVTSVLNLTEQLEKRGHEVKVLTLSRNCHSYKEENVIYAGSVGMGKIYPQARVKIPVVAREYMEELLAWKPDLIHSQCEFSTFFLAKRIAGELDIPIIHTYHTVYEDYTHYFSPQKAWGRSLVQMMTRKLSDQVDAMIAPSGKIERILEGYRVSCPVNVVPSGIDTEKYRRRIDDGSREALPDCCRGYIREAGRVEVLEGDRKSVIGVCRQDEAGSVYLFAANQGAEPVKVRFSSENGTNSAVWMDLEKGRQIPAENPENKGIAVTLEGFESRWLKLSDFEEEAVGREPEGTLGNSCLSLVQASMMDEGGRSRCAKHISMAGKWKCFPQSLNVCRFGETEVSVDGTNWEKVEVKTFIEQCAQTKRLGGEQIAMEGEFGTPRKLRPAYPITCFYKVGFKIRKGELPSELFLLMDRETISGSNAIEINGRVVEASLWKPVRVNDFNNQAADIRSLVREGENEIRIRVCIRKDEDGLRDPFYLWGSFGVGFEDGCHVLTAQPEQVCPDAPWIQGFPYYSGTMEFETEIEFDSSEACILALDWAYPCHENIEVLVNGRSTGICAYSPYLWECGQGTAKQGMNCVTVRISNTLANMLDGTYFDYKEHRLADIRQEAEER